jgi:hypothetical protein
MAGCDHNPTQAKYEGRQLIKLLLRTNDTDLQTSRTEVPVRAIVAFGRLEHPEDATAFLHQGPSAAPITRSITITNRFKEPIMVYRAEVHPAPHECGNGPRSLCMLQPTCVCLSAREPAQTPHWAKGSRPPPRSSQPALPRACWYTLCVRHVGHC